MTTKEEIETRLDNYRISDATERNVMIAIVALEHYKWEELQRKMQEIEADIS